jgi:LPXTG-motif cell wall-anchored protein
VNTAGQALPRTGVAIAALVAAALAALLTGGALRLIGRRRVTA